MLTNGASDDQASVLATEVLTETQAAAASQASEAIVSNFARTTADSPVINQITEARDLSSLKTAMTQASEQADDPAVQAAVKVAILKQLKDVNAPFKDIRDLIDKELGSKFDFVRTDKPDAEVVAALEERAEFENAKNPHLFVQSPETKQALKDLLNGKNPDVKKTLQMQLIHLSHLRKRQPL